MPTTTEIRGAAAGLGRTRVVDMSDDGSNLILWVRPNEDLDSEFRATCALTGEALSVRGWNLPLNDGAERRAELRAGFGA